MYTADGISQILRLAEGLQVVTGTGVTQLRTRALAHMQDALAELWTYRGDVFPFTRGYDNLPVVVGDASVDAPTNFAAMGILGKVFFNVDGEAKPRELVPVATNGPDGFSNAYTSSPAIPAGYFVDFVGSSFGLGLKRPLIQFNCISTVAGSLDIHYERHPPVLVDASDDTNRLDEISDQLARGFVVAQAIGDMYADKGKQDSAAYWRGKAENTLKRAVRQHSQQLLRTQTLPRFFRGRTFAR
jgi:hypothetical protein